MLTDFQLLYQYTTCKGQSDIPRDVLPLENKIFKLFWPGQFVVEILQRPGIIFESRDPNFWVFRSLIFNFRWALVTSLLSVRLKMKIVGNGFTLSLENNIITLYFGHSHVFNVKVPEDMTAGVVGRKSRVLILYSRDRQQLQNFCYKLQQLGFPDAYRGKGLRFVKQQFRLKEGKKKFI